MSPPGSAASRMLILRALTMPSRIGGDEFPMDYMSARSNAIQKPFLAAELSTRRLAQASKMCVMLRSCVADAPPRRPICQPRQTSYLWKDPGHCSLAHGNRPGDRSQPAPTATLVRRAQGLQQLAGYWPRDAVLRLGRAQAKNSSPARLTAA